MTELSPFEQASTKTPMRDPMLVIGGTVLLLIVLWILQAVMPNKAVDDLNKAKEAQGETEQPAAVQSADEDEI